MATPRTLRSAFSGQPDRDVGRAADKARGDAEQTEPTEAPATLPKYKYGLDRKRRLEMIGERTKNLEEQRFNAELDWEQFKAQIDVLSDQASGAQKAEVDAVKNAERQTRLRIISLDAALARLDKKAV